MCEAADLSLSLSLSMSLSVGLLSLSGLSGSDFPLTIVHMCPRSADNAHSQGGDSLLAIPSIPKSLLL